MRLASDSVLLAGTRVTGARLHLGTYLGWLKQIEEASRQVNCLIMICDLQSLDCHATPREAFVLKENIKKVIPQIPIIIESEITHIGALALAISTYMSAHLSNRVSTFKKLAKSDASLPVNVFLYPSFMLADMLSVNAAYMFDKPEGRFQHIDVINDLIKRVNADKRISVHKVQKWAKKPVNIPRLNGQGAMKRETSLQSEMIFVDDPTDEIRNKLEFSIKRQYSGSNRHLNCKVVFPILKSLQQFHDDAYLEAECINNQVNCEKCIERLSLLLYTDIHRKRPNACAAVSEAEERWKRLANENVIRLLKEFISW